MGYVNSRYIVIFAKYRIGTRGTGILEGRGDEMRNKKKRVDKACRMLTWIGFFFLFVYFLLFIVAATSTLHCVHKTHAYSFSNQGACDTCPVPKYSFFFFFLFWVVLLNWKWIGYKLQVPDPYLYLFFYIWFEFGFGYLFGY